MTAEIKALLGVSLPGEQALVAILRYAEAVRDSMEPELLKRLDAIHIQAGEDLFKVWRKLWVDAGVLK